MPIRSVLLTRVCLLLVVIVLVWTTAFKVYYTLRTYSNYCNPTLNTLTEAMTSDWKFIDLSESKDEYNIVKMTCIKVKLIFCMNIHQ